jgi:hypothetical protein
MTRAPYLEHDHSKDLKDRTKRFAVNAIALCRELPLQSKSELRSQIDDQFLIGELRLMIH